SVAVTETSAAASRSEQGAQAPPRHKPRSNSSKRRASATSPAPRALCVLDRARRVELLGAPCAPGRRRSRALRARKRGVRRMPFVTSHMSISLDGFVAGPDQSAENPLGIGGRKVHAWHMTDTKHPVDEAFTQRLLGPRGAYIMGRNMFGPVRGEWGDSDWR